MRGRGARIISAVLLAVTAVSCSSLKSLEDYDPETYRKLDAEGEVLGTVKVTRLGFTWEHYRPGDRRAQSLLGRLQKKAVRKYGENIRLTDVEVGGMSVAPTLAVWGTGVAAMLASEITAYSMSKIVNEKGEIDYEFSDEATTLVALCPIPLLAFLFRSIDATAVVVRADSPMDNDVTLVTDDFIEEKQRENAGVEWARRQERRKAKAAEFMESVRESGSPVLVTTASFDFFKQKLQIKYMNISEKMIRETRFSVTPLNAEGMPTVSRKTGESVQTIVSRLYIPPEEMNEIIEYDLWANPYVWNFRINSVEILFADGTSFTTRSVADLMLSDELKREINETL